MDDKNRLRLEALIRIQKFISLHPTDYTTGATAIQKTKIAASVTNSQTKSAVQQTGLGNAAAAFEQKDTAREDLRDQVADISNLATVMEYEFDGMQAKYHFERNLADQALLAFANAVYTNSAADEANFIIYGLSATFRDDLQDAITAFDAAVSTAAGFVEGHVEATAEFAEGIRQGMIAKRILDVINRRRYASEPGKLAAWFSASTVEKQKEKDDEVEEPADPVDPTP